MNGSLLMTFRMPDVIVEQGHRLGSKILHVNNGLYYHINRRKRDTLYLRCIYYYSKGCTARASCSSRMENFTQTVSHHGHLRDKSLPAVWKLRRKILSRCLRRDPSKYINIVEEESVGYVSMICPYFGPFPFL